MNSKIQLTKTMADVIVQVCFNVTEFSRLYSQDHPQSAKNLFSSNEEIIHSFKKFIKSSSKIEMEANINHLIKTVTPAVILYKSLDVPVENKDQIVAKLTVLQTNLVKLKNEISTNLKP